MPLLAAAGVRHLLRHPAQGALALLGLALGVATIVAVDVATASAHRAFELSLRAVNGSATHQITGGPGGIDEQLYVQLRTRPPAVAGSQALLAPLVAGYATSHERTLQLLGIDPFASAELESGEGVLAAAGGGDAVAAARRWFSAPGAVVMSAATARALGLSRDARFELEVGGVRRSAQLIGTLAEQRPGLDELILTDIAQAQEWLDLEGRLTRIDVRVPAGAPGAELAAALRARLPPALELTATRAEARETLDMTAAFTTNLRAMSLLALLVGTFLIYGATSFAVVQRRSLIGVLRALGATRAEVLGLVLTEAALLGLSGALAGALLGLLLARALIGLVSQTINDLYFVVAVRALAVPWGTLSAALALGVATALAAALVPALEAARSAPRLALARSVLERRSRSLAVSLALLGAALALAAALTVAASGRSLLAGFAALFMLLLSVAAVAPAALRWLARALARALAGRSAVLRLALTEVAGSLSRTGVAVAALGMALAAMIGVAIMVQSFRASLGEWLLATLRADIYVSAPGPSGSPGRHLDPALIPELLAVEGVRAHSEGRRVEVASARGPLELVAVQLTGEGRGGYRFTAGDPERAWPAVAAGAILISEPLAWRLKLAPHERLALRTLQGLTSFAVAGVYREYGNDHGEVLMDLAQYRRYFGDDAVSALGLYLEPAARVEAVIERVRAAARGRQALFIRSNAELRELSMRIFERTFVITRVLYWLAAGVAAVGLLSALLAWELERLRPLAILRSLGLTPLGSAALIAAQTLFMGVAAFLAAIPAGVLTALVLTEVINRRAFGWRIDVHLDAAQFGAAFALALAAAAAAALYPAWRSARGALAPYLREE